MSHPQATAQCARFIRTRLPGARVLGGASTADAVKTVAEHDGPWAALGNRGAAERYGCHVLRASIKDVADNETRFVWLGPVGAPPGGVSGQASSDPPLGPWKTAVVFWGVGSEAPDVLAARPLPGRVREPRGQPHADRSGPASRASAGTCSFSTLRAATSTRTSPMPWSPAPRPRRGPRACSARSQPPSSDVVAPVTNAYQVYRPHRYTGGQSWPLQYQRQCGPRRLQSTSDADVRVAGCSY